MTDQQIRFIEAYLYGPDRFNATRAARAAGYCWPEKQGPRLLTFAAVAEVVEAGFALILEDARTGRLHVGK